MRIKEKPESESRDSDDAIPALAVSGGYSSDFMKRAKSGSGAHSPTPTASPSVAVTNHIFLSVYTPRLVPAGCLKWSTRSSISIFMSDCFSILYAKINYIFQFTKVLLYSCQGKYSCTPVKKVLLYSCQKKYSCTPVKKVLLYSCQKKYSCTPVKKSTPVSRNLGILFKIGLTLLQERFAALLCLVEEVVEHGGVAGKLLDTRLTVELGIEARLDHAQGDG